MDKYIDNVFNHIWSIWDNQDYFRTIEDCYLLFDIMPVALYSKRIIDHAAINHHEGDAIIGIYNSSDSITEASLINKGYSKNKTANICCLKLYPRKHHIILHNVGFKLIGSGQKEYCIETKSDDLIAIYAIFMDHNLRRHLVHDRYNRIMIEHPYAKNMSIETPVLGIPLESS